MFNMLRSIGVLTLSIMIFIQATLTTQAASAPSAIAVSMKTTTYKNGSAKYPVVSGQISKDAQEKINGYMRKEVQQFMQNGKEAQTAQLVTSVTYNQKGLISFLILYDDYYEGAAHGLQTLKGYTFETATGKLLRLRDLYDIDGTGRDFINSEISRQIEENAITLFEPFNGISGNPEFYLVPDYVVIVYQPYEIAPYAAGILEFPIPAKSH